MLHHRCERDLLIHAGDEIRHRHAVRARILDLRVLPCTLLCTVVDWVRSDIQSCTYAPSVGPVRVLTLDAVVSRGSSHASDARVFHPQPNAPSWQFC